MSARKRLTRLLERRAAATSNSEAYAVGDEATKAMASRDLWGLRKDRVEIPLHVCVIESRAAMGA
jgi:hypothetical protein